MDKKTIFIIAGILVALVAAYFFFMRKPETSTALMAWNKYVAKTMDWMRKDPATVKMITEKAKANGKSFEQQLRDDAGWHAKNAGLTDPNEI